MSLDALHLEGCPCRDATCHPPCGFCICESLKRLPLAIFTREVSGWEPLQ